MSGNYDGNGNTSNNDLLANRSTPPPIPPRPAQQQPASSVMFSGYYQPPYQSQPRYYPYYPHANSYGNFAPLAAPQPQQQTSSASSSQQNGSSGGSSSSNSQQQQPAAANFVPYANGVVPYYYRGAVSPFSGGHNEAYNFLERNSSYALKSAENFVRTLDALVQMLETTLGAFYTTFQAIIGVANHFIGLKYTLHQVFSSLAVLKFVRWIFRKFGSLILLRSSNSNQIIESAWSTLSTTGPVLSTSDDNASLESSPFSLSSLSLLAVVVGTPVLIYRLIKSLMSSMEDNRRWASGEHEHYAGVALYDFIAANSNEISITTNQNLHIAPKELQPPVKGWLLASVNGNEIGLVPANYVKVLNKVSGTVRPSKK